ncbi:MAG: type II secretion system inner membrane protein GspF [Desulfuromonadales bacterium]|nr:type II secretion system inner membrane protein GspF [Desulfuromonadales bacterium]MDW7757350.1 type II secretion system inner membrane protein GspF [Desulfuromonadales bacterium]
MPLFEYTGFDARGKKVNGVIEASGKKLGLQKLREQGIYATDLKEEKTGRGEKAKRSLTLFKSSVSTMELAAATRQMATLLGAGLPLDETLQTVSSQLENPTLGRTLSRVREEVVRGESLHQSLASEGRVFPELYVNMIEVGENSGTLEQVLQRLADFLEEQVRMKSRLRAALAYPILMALIGSGVLVFLVTFVVPKVTRMLEDLGQSLPWPTLLLIRGSDLLVDYAWLILALLAAAVFAFLRYRRTERGRWQLHRLALSIPVVGRLNLLVATSRFARTLGTLLQSGLPLLAALDITRNLLQNQLLREALEDTAAAVREGEGLSAPLKRAAVFPPMLTQMTAVGERSGDMETMLFRVADAYDHEVELAITGALSLLEPLMILLMGTVVGFIVMAILLPIFQASQGIG